MDEVKKIEFYSFKLPLDKKLNIKNNFINFREGIMIKADFRNKISSYGEISPLPFFHKESLADTVKELPQIKKIISGLKNDFKGSIFSSNSFLQLDDFFDFLKTNKYLKEQLETFPSLAFGLESVFFSYFILKNNALKDVEKLKIKTSRLISDLSLFDERAFLKIADSGFERIKIKVGRQDPGFEVEKINKISDLILKLKSNIKIRLDSNSLWNLNQAVDFCKKLKTDYVDYIEDPVSSIFDFEKFYLECRIFTALDEYMASFKSFSEIDNILKETGFEKNRFLKAAVLKPSHMGGFLKCKKFIDMARLKNISPVLSHCFESNYSLSLSSIFAYISETANNSSGLNSEDYFSKNLLNENISGPGSTIMLEKAIRGLTDINEKHLNSLNI